jgi:predicted GNAT family acetyltransferase
MLAAHPEAIEIYYTQENNAAGLLLLFPTSTFAYDRQSYPDDAWIALLTVAQPALIQLLLPHLPRDQRIIFKLADETVQTALLHQLPLERVTAFRSYTAPATHPYTPHPTVVERTTPDERLYPFFAAQGHERQDVDAYFAKEGHAFTRYENNVPVAACFTYQNFETVHEIGGVLTIPTARRKGYAKQVVETAVASLQRRGCTPRYQVHEVNRPSIRLAEQIGLQLFVTIEHWRYTPQPVQQK